MKFFALLAVAAMALSASSQDPAAPPKPSAEMKKLEVFNGEWAGKAKNYLVPGELPVETPATVSIEMIMDGMYQRMRYGSEMPGMGKIDGMILTCWDETKKSYRSWNYNNMIPVPVEESSKWEGTDVVGKTEPLAAYGGMIEHTRMSLKGKDELIIKIEAEMGGQRMPMLELELKRKK
jgi:hypothetical protein